MRALVLGVALSLFAIACGGGAPQVAATAPAPGKSRPAVGSADAGTAAAANADSNYLYAYNPVGKRDPFRNLLDDLPTRGGSESPSLCGDPLCQFDLDQLALVAVVSGDANPLAMLEDPAHTGYIVRRNSKVGRQGGKVTDVKRDCVVVTEYFQTPDGKVNPNRVNLCVKQDKRGAPVLDLLNNKNYESP